MTDRLLLLLKPLAWVLSLLACWLRSEGADACVWSRVGRQLHTPLWRLTAKPAVVPVVERTSSATMSIARLTRSRPAASTASSTLVNPVVFSSLRWRAVITIGDQSRSSEPPARARSTTAHAAAAAARGGAQAFEPQLGWLG